MSLSFDNEIIDEAETRLFVKGLVRQGYPSGNSLEEQYSYDYNEFDEYKE